MSNNTHGDKREYDPYGQYFCGRCSGIVSPSRPPTYIAQNCSCSDLASFANGGGTRTRQVLAHDEQFHYDQTTPLTYHQPESYTTEKSALGQEGVENNAPNLHTSNGWTALHLGPQTLGLNGANQFLSNNSTYTVEQWLGIQSQNYERIYNTQHPVYSSDRYIDHANHNQAPTTQKKSKKSQPSVRSAGSGDAMGDSWTREADPMTGAGGWTHSDGDYLEVSQGREGGEEYPYATEISGFFD